MISCKKDTFKSKGKFVRAHYGGANLTLAELRFSVMIRVCHKGWILPPQEVK